MKSSEFDVIFKEKTEEFASELRTAALSRGFAVHGLTVSKAADFVYVYEILVSQMGFRSLPRRMIYTLMYNPKTKEYIWHEDAPIMQHEKAIN